MRRMALAASPLAVALGVLALAAGPAAASGPPATVYTSSNSASGNAVLAFHRAPDGSLSTAGSFLTGGNGTGGGLNNQGALALGAGSRTLFVVNAGSNSVSTFAVRHHQLGLIGTTPSGGPEPVSITVSGDRLFALNAGDNSVAGFRGVSSGRLEPIPGSTATLPGAGPAEIAFADGDRALVVTERDSNTIVTVPVGPDGTVGTPVSTNSSGATPFGFDIDRHNHVIVSEATGGQGGTSAVSSYNLLNDGSLSTISGSIGDNQNAACWLVVTKDGRFAYTANTASPSISSYTIGRDGSLSLRQSVAAANAPGSHTTDLAQPNSGRELFALTAGVGTLSAYRVAGNGDLVSTGAATGVPTAATGLVAR